MTTDVRGLRKYCHGYGSLGDTGTSWPWVVAGCGDVAVGAGSGGTRWRGCGPGGDVAPCPGGSSGTLQALFALRYAMKCLDKKRIKMKQGETLALNERIMLSLVSTGVRGRRHRAGLARRLQAVALARGEGR